MTSGQKSIYVTCDICCIVFVLNIKYLFIDALRQSFDRYGGRLLPDQVHSSCEHVNESDVNNHMF